jgi:lipoprotein NlpD
VKYFSYLLLLFLVACGGSKSPVISRGVIDSATESERLGGRLITIVQSGDTWYAIAFENSLSVEDLSTWNGMTQTDKLRVGQRLRLTKPIGFQASKKQIVVIDRSIPNGQRNASTKPSQRTQVPKKSAQQTSPKPSQRIAKSNTGPVSWSWPLKGKVVTQFSAAKGLKGIDISARQNQNIQTAAAGKVVYQGNGIKVYNNLIIIKHNDELLSAYAHNEKVFVKEGQYIKKGQVISTVGLKNGKPLLHFEIRRDGKPVNPLNYLK